MAVAFVTGAKQIDRVLSQMKRVGARTAVQKGMRKAGSNLAKRVKSQIPSRYKNVRKSIGWRALKVSEAPEGGVKIGAKVGIKKKKWKAAKRSSRSGTGISPANVHWWFTGTDERFTGKRGGPRRRAGRMNPQAEPVSQTAQRYSAVIRHDLQTHVWQGLLQQIRKGKAF